VRAARAKRIVLINSDLLVAKGWLYAMWSTLEEDKHSGIVGPMMLGDGHLITEAGGVVWRDASAANYGRGVTHMEHSVRGACCQAVH
jgi:GT2 family glycosyltransferase